MTSAGGLTVAMALVFAFESLLGQEKVTPADPRYAYYRRGQFYQLHGKYDSALVYFQKQQVDGVGDNNFKKQIDKRILECRSGITLALSPRNFIITNLGPQVNSEFEDYAPVLSEDEDLLVFTSRRLAGNISNQRDREGNYYEDIFSSRRDNGQWTDAKNVGKPVNTQFHDSDLALSADGKQLYLYTDENEGDILISEFENGKWSLPKPMPFPINTPYHESSVSVSTNGKQMFVASERPGGLGGLDIYLIEMDQAGQWLPARNLGIGINSEWDEDSPHIDNDGNTLYFSSTGHNSMGGYDLFRSMEMSGAWSNAENLGVPINTPQNDSYFVSTSDGKRAYYSSVRPGGLGKEDIYVIALPPELARAEVPRNSGDGIQRIPTNPGGVHFKVVYFDFGSASLSAGAQEQLNLFAEYNLHSKSTIQIRGHTDYLGTEKFNDSLSLSRAKIVAAYLKSKGMDSIKMDIQGWGFHRPMVSNDDERDGCALNRRVEIRVIDN